MVHSRSSSGGSCERYASIPRSSGNGPVTSWSQRKSFTYSGVGNRPARTASASHTRLADVEHVHRGAHAESPHLAERIGDGPAHGVERRILEPAGVLVPEPRADDLLRHVVRREDRTGTAGGVGGQRPDVGVVAEVARVGDHVGQHGDEVEGLGGSERCRTSPGHRRRRARGSGRRRAGGRAHDRVGGDLLRPVGHVRVLRLGREFVLSDLDDHRALVGEPHPRLLSPCTEIGRWSCPRT